MPRFLAYCAIRQVIYADALDPVDCRVIDKNHTRFETPTINSARDNENMLIIINVYILNGYNRTPSIDSKGPDVRVTMQCYWVKPVVP